MRSKHVDDFNHNDWADDYDDDVRNEANPIRSGYGEMLEWVAGKVNKAGARSIVDLGSGTGNLTKLLADGATITAVDTSSRMHEVARTKLKDHKIRFVEDDILAFVTERLEHCDAIVSTYAFHHLMPEEKQVALNAIILKLRPGGHVVIGDLMFENATAKEAVIRKLSASSQTDIVRDIKEEFFWDIEKDCKMLLANGLTLDTRQFSDLSWAIVAVSGSA